MHLFTRLFLCCFFFSGMNLLSHAQGDPAVDLIPKVEAGFMGLGVGLEYPVSQKGLIDIGLGMGGGYYRTAENFNFSLTGAPVFYLNAGYRHTYNRQQMVLRSDNTLHNSGNFFGGKIKYASQTLSDPNVEDVLGELPPRLNNVAMAEVHWGMQRPISRRFFFNFHVGVGFAWDMDYGGGALYPAANVMVAYNLFSEKTP
ncbi:hypothetical protein [Pleomorphovibrio marinus]|uniref:hypothetical protein n=1 Tax=Pleomorphovibrio marinus TaxID=2164132 RepID=UPI0018E58D98|nr:hypothetical protein [Pleomorphovibrio marinus]